MARTEALIDLILNNVNVTQELDKVEKKLNEINKISRISLEARVVDINLEKTFKTIKQVENAVASLSGKMRSISAPGSGDLGDQLRVAATAANQFFDSLSKGNRYLANTTAGLNEQSRAFASLAANINSADKRFIDYTQGAQAAQDKNLKPLFRQFEALRRLYEEGLTGQGSEIASREMGLGMFEALKKEVPNTEAALRSFYGELLRVRNLIGSRSTAAFGIESQLVEIEEQLLKIEQERLETRAALNRELSSSVQGALAGMEGRGRDPFGMPDAQINAALDARAEAYGKQVEETQALKKVLAGMESVSRDPFGISDQQINAGLEQRASIYETQRKEIRALEEALGKMESRKIDWATALGIDAADVAAEKAKELTRQWEIAQKSLKGFDGVFGRLQASFGETGSFFQNVSPEQAIDKIVRQFTPSLTGTAGFASLSQLEKPAKLSSQKLNLLASSLQELAAQIDPLAPGAKRLLKAINRTSSSLQNEQAGRAPDADFLVRLTKNPRLAAGISEGLIGGAFPLLFGQGVGAAAGGGIGGFAGGYAGGALGFGLSLIGTAVGSAVDATVNNLKELASSLKEPTAALEAMKTAGLRVDSSLEDLVRRLESVGNVAAAQAIVLDEVQRRLGPGSITELVQLDSAQKQLEEGWAAITAEIQVRLLPVLTGFIQFLGAAAGEISNFASQSRLQRLDPQKFEELRSQAIGETARGPFGSFGDKGKFEARLSELSRQELSRRFADEFGQVPLTEEGQRKQQLLPFQQTVAALSAGLEASDIAKKYTDAIKTAAEEQKDLDKQRFELIESYEQSIADIRKGVEQRITQERLSVAAKENELFAAQGDIRLQQLRNANAELRAGLFGNEIGQQLADVVSEFTEKQLSTENEIANRRRSLELELESRKIEIEQYKIDVATQVSKLNISTQRQVEKIQDGILKKNQAYDRSRFEIEKRININNLEIKRLEAKQQENLFRTASNTEASTGNAALAKQNRELADLYANQARFIDAQKNAVRSFAPPPQLSFRSVSASASVSTAGLDAVAARGNQLLASIAGAKDELSLLASSNDFTGFNSRLKEIADQGVAGLANQFERLKGELSGDPLGAQFAKIKEAFETISEAPELAPYKELIFEYGKLAKENLKLGASLEFFLDKAGEQSSRLDSLRIEINSAISGSTELEKALTDLAMRGISPASEEFKILTENAAKLDQLQQKLEIINSFKTASSELTLSLRGLIENFYELGSASEAVKRVGEELSRKSLGFVLDIAFKPVEQAMQKTMFDLAERFGFDIKPEQLQQLEEIKILKNLVASIEKEIVKKQGAGIATAAGAPTGISLAGRSGEDLFSLNRIEDAIRLLGPLGADTNADIERLRGVVSGAGNAAEKIADIEKSEKDFRDKIFRLTDVTQGYFDAYGKVDETSQALGNEFNTRRSLLNENILKSFEALRNQLKTQPGGISASEIPGPVNQIVPGPGYSPQDLPHSQRITPAGIPGANIYGIIPGAPGQPTNKTDQQHPGIRQMIRGPQPQSSLPGAFTGIGGSDDQAYEIFKVKTEQWVLGIALETYEKLGTVFDKTIREIQTVPELETYKKNQFSLIENFLNGMPAEARPAMASDITSIIEAAAARRASEIGSGDISVGSTTEISRGLGQVPAGANAAVYAMELSRALPEVEKAFSATTFSIAEGNTKLSTITPQWTKNLGQAVTGLGMAASAVVGIIGGIQNIKQGGAGNIFTGIGSILTTIGGIGMSAAGFMKPSMPGGGFGAPAGADFLGGASALPSSFKFADGGILQSPTLFNFEDAGVTRTGQAGEAGVEAIMPLKRTKDGRLGVEADLSVPFEGGSIMLDEEPATGASGASSIPFRSRSGVEGQQSLSIPFLKGGGLLGADGGDSSDTIRFESTVINGVEFVTRDEAEEIGRRSETRGAARGAELAHRRIRNNPQTRRSIGMQ